MVKTNENCGIGGGVKCSCDCKCENCEFSLDKSINRRISQLGLAINQSNTLVAILDINFAPIWLSDALLEDFKNKETSLSDFSLRDYVHEFSNQEGYDLMVSYLKCQGFWSGYGVTGSSLNPEKLKIRIMLSEGCGKEQEILVVIDKTNDEASMPHNEETTIVKSLAQLQHDVEVLSPLLSFNTNIHLVILTIRNIADIAFIRGEHHVNRIFMEYVKLVRPKFSQKVKFYRVSDLELGLVIETSLDAREVHSRLKHFVTLVEANVEVDNYTYHLMVHAGVSTLHANQSVDTLIRNATFAKDVAENEKSPIEAYSLDDVVKHIEDFTLSERFQSALYSDSLHMAYQPIVNKDKTLWGYESLIRWTDQTYGKISALKIIEFAERSSSMIRLGYWIIRRVFNDIKVIDSKTMSSKIFAINLSLEQFDDPNFANNTYNLSLELEVSPSRIMFEITESHSFTDLKSIVKVLNQLREYGFLIALDDFGVGYSTMMNLVELPLNVVKLDKSLIANINEKQNSFMVCQSVVALAQQLGLEVIAEGIESVEDESLIQRLDVTLLQGFYYFKPMALEHLVETIIESKCQKA